MTVAMPVSMVLPLFEERSRFRDSGVVIRISGGFRIILRRSSPGVSPLRVWTVIAGKAAPACSKWALRSASGLNRFLRTSLFNALSGET